MTLDELLTHGEEAARWAFHATGEVHPTWIAELKSGILFPIFAPFPDDDAKDKTAAYIRHIFKEFGVVRYVFMAEAWTLETKDLNDPVLRTGMVRDHPDRREVISFLAEEKTRAFSAAIYILRPEHGEPKLSALKKHEAGKMTGRLAGMLQD